MTKSNLGRWTIPTHLSGFDIYEIMNADLTNPLFATKCRKHEKLIYFSFGTYETRAIEEAARDALTTCDECKTEVVMPPTRWPEGAEL